MTDMLNEDAIALMERRVRDGLGPEAGLVDQFKNGEDMRILLSMPAGRALVTDTTTRALGALMVLTAEEHPSVEDQREALLALRLNVCILRRMSSIVSAGRIAEKQMHLRAIEADAEGQLHA